MTQRDDLVSRLNAGCVFQYVGDGSDNQEVDTLATYATMQEAATALEAKDAEIARLRQELADTNDDLCLPRHRRPYPNMGRPISAVSSGIERYMGQPAMAAMGTGATPRSTGVCA